MGRVTSRHKVVRIDLDRETTRSIDTVAGEEPLEIRVNGETFTVTMRTPGADVDLAHGLLRAEGVIAQREDVLSAVFCSDLDTLNVLNLTIPGRSVASAATGTRNLATLGGCGLCGTTAVEAVESVVSDRPPEVVWEAASVVAALDELRTRQQVFAKTGGTHAAGLAPAPAGTTGPDSPVKLAIVREDIGRHNAADKVLGAALVGEVDTRGGLLVMSSRASFEIVQKAAVAGVSVLACVSAPSSLAIEAADRLGVTLVAFARGRRLSVYSHSHRIPH
ncbi:formate dehydrogenase accessory sulfurtransferase FdhD [Knoellia subterranea]|uniref:Sulfur carrier protein FdhD n=1 Tax=Knoellia subterranea KCTC 19937 TaxID=1385521 RepID=A0A0A0JMH0_9MICO|nr:formate dehydrogenase accessory sulfurtransferase FdhD [Knoellia subterranea]KGN38600.1 formate dehydrogenase accessory protein FdhD [Knoellia subterranea KCTC 19937]